ncbi:hypothetical protein PCG10_005870 [Penicillium crustosum]|uniref:Uncharacterized protein n=1 Tax=Penicillium crustosum TaxID=36656 RepID=A0A9P5L4A0_PENCR|nr:hypothetical protein PCG10_005870 [Penicillium crustosum]
MRLLELKFIALAHLAISVNGLAVAGRESSSLTARATSVASPVASSSPSPSPSPTGDTQEAPQCTGYLSYSPSEWQARLGHQFDENLPESTCLTEYPGSGKGTDIHVKQGCILVNESKHCENWDPTSNVPDDIDNEWHNDNGAHISSVFIYAMFDGDDTHNVTVVPGCMLYTSWPSAWSDLDFTADNCLTDRTGDFRQCCSDSTTTTEIVLNPYS